MEKQPFTNAGFQALQAMLYINSDAELNQEADQITYDFIGWIITHFELDPSQVVFLVEIEHRVLSFIAAQTSFAVANRLNIQLDKPLFSYDAEEKPGKIIKTTTTLSAESSNIGDAEGEGSLTIHIQYPS